MFQLKLDPFEGLSAPDFDAYEERKWASNRFNLERMKAREHLTALAHITLDTHLLDAHGLSLEASHDHPTVFNHKRVDAQWLFALRHLDERRRIASLIESEHSLKERIEDAALHHLHAVLALRLEFEGLDLLFGVHRSAAIDRRNLHARLESPEERDAFLKLCNALPETAQIVLGSTVSPSCTLDADRLSDAMENLPDAEWIALRVRIPREDVRLQSSEFGEEARGFFAALLPLYTFTSWSNTNDEIGVNRQLEEVRKARRQAVNALEPGERVRVIAGLLSGRTGEVVDLDGHGNARVRLGTMTMKLPVESLHAF